jgi:sugar transferase (PEP-CTERM/EpsH1 system associated)
MKILFVTGNVPYPPTDGWKIRVFALVRHLANRHHVSVASFIRTTEDPQALDQLRMYCEEVRLIPRPSTYSAAKLVYGLIGRQPFSILNYADGRMAAVVREMTQRQRYDFIQAESIHMAQYCLGIGPRTILDLHNIESLLMQRYAEQEANRWKAGYAFLTARKLTRYERLVCPRFTHCLTCSDEDQRLVNERTGTTAITVVPNGVEVQAYDPSSSAETSIPRLVFIGRMDYHANVDGVRWFCREVLPDIQARRRVLFQIVGGFPTEEVRRLARPDQIEVTGFVSDVRPYLQSAAMVVVPLRVGGGTRLKILEALAMGKTVLSTRVGAEGIAAAPGEGIVQADDARQFAEEAVSLLQDRSRRAGIGAAGRRLAERHYDWSAIVQRLERLYDGLPHSEGHRAQRIGELERVP